MTKAWFIGNWYIKLSFKRGYWRWAVSEYGSSRECTGKDKDVGFALYAALDQLSRLAAERRVKD